MADSIVVTTIPPKLTLVVPQYRGNVGANQLLDWSGNPISASNPLPVTITGTIGENINIAQVAGATVATGHGTAAGTLRVELPTDGTGTVGLIAGSAIVGKVGIDQTTPGTTNKVITGTIGADGSTTLTTGGTAQNLFSAATPTNGFEICNPDPTLDLWVSDSTTAAVNGTGSYRVAANGGTYTTPSGYRPIGAVSIIGSTTGQKITARRW